MKKTICSFIACGMFIIFFTGCRDKYYPNKIVYKLIEKGPRSSLSGNPRDQLIIEAHNNKAVIFCGDNDRAGCGSFNLPKGGVRCLTPPPCTPPICMILAGKRCDSIPVSLNENGFTLNYGDYTVGFRKNKIGADYLNSVKNFGNRQFLLVQQPDRNR